jgi:hypothetical protein
VNTSRLFPSYVPSSWTDAFVGFDVPTAALATSGGANVLALTLEGGAFVPYEGRGSHLVHIDLQLPAKTRPIKVNISGNSGTQPPWLPSPPPPSPPPTPTRPACHSHRCPNDFINSSITGTFPDGSDPCLSAHICVKDVLPGCDCYRGDSDSAWGVWCEDAIAAFDTGGVVNGSNVPAHTAPKNIGGDPYAGNPIYYFAAPTPKSYVLYLPPAHGES